MKNTNTIFSSLDANKTSWKILVTLILICVPFLNSLSAQSQSTIKSDRISLLLLIDSSGSMKETDPDNIRKLAAQSIVSLLSKEDKVAIVEFDSSAEILSTWRSADDKDEIYNAINKAGNSGGFTDFRAGIEKCIPLMNQIDPESRGIVLVLSDGLFEPNLSSDRYAPYNLGYIKESLGKSGEKKREIRIAFQEKILPVAKRIIETEILPQIKSNKVEIFTVAFSPKSDKEFLRFLSEETNTSRPEIHHFYVEHATDLVNVFTGIASYWKSFSILYQEEGIVKRGSKREIYLDEFLKSAFFIVFTDKKAEFNVRRNGNSSLSPTPDTHPNLMIFPLGRGVFPSKWIYGFSEGEGRYKLIIVGENSLQLVLEGLKSKYVFGETITASIFVKTENRNVYSTLNPESILVAEVGLESGTPHKFNLQKSSDHFSLLYYPKQSGNHQIRFTLYAKGKQGYEILPRPSRKYGFEVMPNFFVSPERLNFGRLKKAKLTKQSVKVHSGLERRVSVKVTNKIIGSSRCLDEKDKLPQMEEFDFTINPSEILEKNLLISIPKKGCWGDYEGEIQFVTTSGEQYTISYRVHVPSWREWITKIALLVFVIFMGILAYLSYIWGRLGSPKGVMRFMETPVGIIERDRRLSRIKKGRLLNLINWKRNVISLGGHKSHDVTLKNIPRSLCIDLKFYRFGKNYIANKSKKDSGVIIDVIDPISGAHRRKPGQYYKLHSMTKAKFEEYEILFERIDKKTKKTRRRK